MSKLYNESNKSIILVIIAFLLIIILGSYTLNCLQRVGLKNIINPLWHGEEYRPGDSNNHIMTEEEKRLQEEGMRHWKGYTDEPVESNTSR